jgi:phage/plasmid-associated DNA primase
MSIYSVSNTIRYIQELREMYDNITPMDHKPLNENTFITHNKPNWLSIIPYDIEGIIPTDILYSSYTEWCRSSNEKIVKKIQFCRDIKTKMIRTFKQRNEKRMYGYTFKQK